MRTARIVIGGVAFVLAVLALLDRSWWAAAAMGCVVVGQVFSEWDARRVAARRATVAEAKPAPR